LYDVDHETETQRERDMEQILREQGQGGNHRKRKYNITRTLKIAQEPHLSTPCPRFYDPMRLRSAEVEKNGRSQLTAILLNNFSIFINSSLCLLLVGNVKPSHKKTFRDCLVSVHIQCQTIFATGPRLTPIDSRKAEVY
jgi:hypothetical protein